MLKKLLVGIVAAVVLLSASPADAGKVMGELQITPAEPTVEDAIVLTNVDEGVSTCEAPFSVIAATQLTPIIGNAVVDVEIEDAEGQTVLEEEAVEPDEDGNWSVDVGKLDEGDYTAYAVCYSPLVEADPESLPDFQYEPLEFSVSQVPPSSSTTTTAAPTTTTTAAAAAAALTAPRYTG